MTSVMKYGHLADAILDANQDRFPWLRIGDCRLLCRMAEQKIALAYLGTQQVASLGRLQGYALAKQTGDLYGLTAKGWQLVHEAYEAET